MQRLEEGALVPWDVVLYGTRSWIGSQKTPPEPPVLAPHSAGAAGTVATISSCLHWCWNLNSDPLVYVAITLTHWAISLASKFVFLPNLKSSIVSKSICELGMVAHKGSLIPAMGAQRMVDLCIVQPSLHSVFQDSQDYTVKPCLEKQNETITTTKRSVV